FTARRPGRGGFLIGVRRRLAGSRAPILLRPAGALEVDGRSRESRADWTAAADGAGPRTVGVDAVDHLEPVPAVMADVVVDGHCGGPSSVSRGAGACRTSGRRRRGREPRQTRSG